MLAVMSSPRRPSGGDPADEPTNRQAADPSPGDAEPPPRIARLRVTGGSDRGREFVLREPETSVGRGTMNGIILTDLAVSRRHLLLLFDGNGYKLKDLGSGNGTQVNGELLAGDAPLEDGDVIDIGKTTLRFAYPQVGTERRTAPPPVAPPAPVDVAVRQTLPLGTQGVSTPAGSRRASTSLSNLVAAAPRRGPRILGFLGAAVVLIAAVFGVVAMVGPRRQTRTVAVAVPIPAPIPVRVTAPPEPLPPVALAEAPAPAAMPLPEPLVDRRPPTSDRKKRLAAEPVAAKLEHPAEREASVQYRDMQFAEAARILRAAADADPASANRLNGIARDFVAVGAGLARGDAVADDSPAQSLVAYQEALAADVRSGGFHAPTVRTKIARVAPAAAVAYADAGRWEQARTACDLAASFGAAGDERVAKVRHQLETKARELFLAAQELSRDKPDEARSLYRRITLIVPEGSMWYTKASGSLR